MRTRSGYKFTDVEITENLIQLNGTDDPRVGIFLNNDATTLQEALTGGISAFISGNEVTTGNDSLAGIAIVGNNPGCVVSYNRIENAQAGFVVYPDQAGSGMTMDCVLRANSFVGNTETVKNPFDAPVEALYNWWGTADSYDPALIESGIDGENVEFRPWLGRDPWGATDLYINCDTEAAIDRALLDAVDGDTVFLIPGSYEGSFICANDGVTVEGPSDDLSLIEAEGITSPAFSITGDNVTLRHVTIINGYFPAGANSATYQQSGVYVDAQGVTLNRVNVTTCYAGVYMTSSASDLLVNRCDLHDNIFGMHLSGTGITISGCEIYENDAGATPYGIMFANTAANIVISGCSITGHYDGLNGFAISNNSSATAEAVHNWWGSETGPYNVDTNPDATGDKVSTNVLFTPWVGIQNSDTDADTLAVTGTVVSDGESDTLEDEDLTLVAQVTAAQGVLKAYCGMAQFRANPVNAGFSADFDNGWFQIYADDFGNLAQVTVRIYFPEAAGYEVGDTPVYFFDGEDWIQALNQTVVPHATLAAAPGGGNGHDGYVEFTVESSYAFDTGYDYAITGALGSPSSGGGGGGCFVATAAFGSYGAAQVLSLTKARDGSLAESSTSANLVSLYYEISPSTAMQMRNSRALCAIISRMLDN